MKSPLTTLLILGALFSTPTLTSAQSVFSMNEPISGFTEPYRSIDLAASEMGTISEIAVVEGQEIKAGVVLARLNEDVLQAALKVVEESKKSKGKLNSANAELKMYRERLQKLIGLQSRNHASQVEVDRANSQLEIAMAKVESVTDELRIKSFELLQILAQLEQRRLRSPIDGIVSRVLKDEGEFVSANDPVVLHIVQVNPLLVVFSVPHKQAQTIRAGQTLPLTIGEQKLKTTGIVEFVAPTTDAQSGTRRVKIRIENHDLRLPAGAVCQLENSAVALQSSGKTTKQVGHRVPGKQE